MPELPLSALPASGALDGTEEVPLVKDGITSKATTEELAQLVYEQEVATLPSLESTKSMRVVLAAGILGLYRRVLRAAGAAGIHTTTAETAALNPGTIVIAAGALTLETVLEIRGGGALLNNTGGSTTTTVRLKVNGTTFASMAFVQPTASATQRTYAFFLRLRRADGGGFSFMSPDGSIQTVTLNNLGTLSHLVPTMTPVVFDPAAPANITMTVQHSVSNANVQAAADFTYVELIETVVNV